MLVKVEVGAFSADWQWSKRSCPCGQRFCSTEFADSVEISPRILHGYAPMLTESDIQKYREEGQIVLPFCLPEEMVSCIERRSDELLQGHPELSADYVPGLVEIDEQWLAVGCIPGILDAVEKLIGPDIINWGSGLFGKPANDGIETPWHQDGEYWPIRPLATCTAWIAIDDATPENGCLRVVPGSHKDQELLPHITPEGDYTLYRRLEDEAAAEENARDVVLERGQVSIHDVFMVHGSRPNASSKSRRGIAFRFMPTTSHFDYDLNDKLVRDLGVPDLGHRKLFLLSGTDRCGKNRTVELPEDLGRLWDIGSASIAAE